MMLIFPFYVHYLHSVHFQKIPGAPTINTSLTICFQNKLTVQFREELSEFKTDMLFSLIE